MSAQKVMDITLTYSPFATQRDFEKGIESLPHKKIRKTLH
jgi:hypothetical protein